MLTLEELIYAPNGELRSRGPGVYKIPSFADIQAAFNVSLLKESASIPRAIFSSKVVSEPPLLLTSSIFFAINEAVVMKILMNIFF